MVRQFASVFSQKHGVQFEIEENAIAKIVERSRETRSNVTDFCNNLFKDYPYGLKLLRDRETNLKFIVPVSAIENPDKFLSERVVEFYRQAKEAESSRPA
jgi:ATP-dependent Clp protease ATP-binding subunit ClpX